MQATAICPSAQRVIMDRNLFFGRNTRKSCSMAPNARAIFVVNTRPGESLQAFAAGRIHGKNAVSHSDEHLNSVLGTLEECRRVLKDNDGRETAELLSIAILDLRMKLKGVANSELRALCDEMLRGVASESADRPTQQPRRPLLRVVK